VALNADLNTLDGEFNKLSEHVAKGERDDHSPASLNRMMSH
jgi:ribosomal protein S15P/S13E